MACRAAAFPAAVQSRSRRDAKILYDLTHADQSGRAHASLSATDRRRQRATAAAGGSPVSSAVSVVANCASASAASTPW